MKGIALEHIRAGVCDNRLPVTIRIMHIIDPGRSEIAPAVMQIEKQIGFPHQLLDNFHYPVVDILGSVIVELSVHVAIHTPLVADDRLEVGAGDDNQVSSLQDQIRVEIRRQEPAWFISLDTSQNKCGVAVKPSIQSIHIQFIGSILEIHLMLPIGAGFFLVRRQTYRKQQS